MHEGLEYVIWLAVAVFLAWSWTLLRARHGRSPRRSP
jgi:hypothetical protein